MVFGKVQVEFPSHMKKSDFYFPELDTLRFLAFLMVLVHHSPFWKSIEIWRTFSKYGWMGVDLFLCLSAFLFTRLLFVEFKETGSVHIKNFYIRRAFRIWPLYFFFVILMASLTIYQYGINQQVVLRTLGLATFTDDFLSASDGYNTVILFSSHLWTISYEEQVYLVIPWLLRKLYQMKKMMVALLLTGMALTGTITRAVMIYNNIDHPDIWVLPFTHFESVIGGILIGLGVFDDFLKRIPSILWLIVGIIALWQVTELPNVNEVQWKLMLTYPLVGIGMSLIIYSVMQNGFWMLSNLMRNPITGYLGKISYGLYVYHLLGVNIAYSIANRFVDPQRLLFHPASVLFLAFLITTLLSAVSYQILERPFLRMKDRFTIIKSRPV